jgi:hypothetical protein
VMRDVDLKALGVNGIISSVLEVGSEVWCGFKDGYLLTLNAYNADKIDYIPIHDDKVYPYYLHFFSRC